MFLLHKASVRVKCPQACHVPSKSWYQAASCLMNEQSMPPPSSPKIKVLGQRYSISNPADLHISHWTLPFSQHYVCTNLSLFCLPQWCLLPSWESSAFSYSFTHNFQTVTSKMAHVSVLWLLNKQNTGFLLGKHSHTSMKPWQPIHSCLSKAATHCVPAPP